MCLTVIAGLLMPLNAKRVGPEDVPPVTYRGIRYEAPHWAGERGRTQNGGYIEAWEVEGNKFLWDLRVYNIERDPGMEEDVQDVFITSLSIQEDDLIVVNERGDRFRVNLKTRHVSPMKK